MRKKLRLVCAALVVTSVVCAMPALSFWHWIKAELSQIEAPVAGKTLDYHPVEIVVSLKAGALPDTFEAWLNGHDITSLFEPVPGGLHAYVTPDDGLNRRIIGEDKRLSKFNLLVTTIEGTGKKWDIDLRTFHVEYKPVSTVRDDRGVWFISGGSLFDVFDAMGYAVATDRLWQMETYRRSARGTLSEIFGPSQLDTDMFMRTIGYSDEELFEGFDALDRESQIVLEGYVEGINRRIDEIRAVPTLKPFEFYALDFDPEYWTEEDILAWMALLSRQFDCEGLGTGQLENAVLLKKLKDSYGPVLGPTKVYDMFNDLRWINDPDALTYIPSSTPAMRSMIQAPMTAEQQSAGLARSGDVAAGLTSDIAVAAEDLVWQMEEVKKNLKDINAFVKMGSYAWAVSGRKTANGKPIIYSGPQMGFEVPSIVLEGSIRGGGLEISGMSVPGVPGIIIGRTPHHAWSMQVGHAHTVDYYFEPSLPSAPHRVETILVRGGSDVVLPVYRSSHGPVISSSPAVIAWKYAHWGYELRQLSSYLKLARARSMDEFGKGIEEVAVSQHFCYVDRDGNIAYWMSGRDPVRQAGGEWRLPQGSTGSPPMEWDAAVLIARSTDRNTPQGYYCGWNNKSSAGYNDSVNRLSYHFGPFHRAHVIDDYLSAYDDLTYDEIRDLALFIATTDSFGGGGIPWDFVSDDFTAAVQAAQAAGFVPERQAALDLLAAWDGHFVDGGPAMWPMGSNRADAWILQDAWIREAIRLTFENELGPGLDSTIRLFNVMLKCLAGETSYDDWFAPYTPDYIIVTALDTVLAALGDRPWGTGQRGVIDFKDAFFATPANPEGVIHSMPFSSRSTYAHCVQFGRSGPIRIESMFPLGQSGAIYLGPVFDPNFFSMTSNFDPFVPRSFPLFD